MNSTQKTNAVHSAADNTEAQSASEPPLLSNNYMDLVELDEKGEPVLSPIEEDLDEEFKTTAYANNAFAFNEEKLQRESVAISEDVRSTDIEDSTSAVSQSH